MNSTRDETILRAFGSNLKRLRLGEKISLRKLADEIEVDFSQIHRIEQGKSNPTLTMIIALAKGLKVETNKLFDFESGD